jgi:hypothetical protein
LNQRKSGGDWILGEGRDSLRNPPRNDEEAPNLLEITKSRQRREFGEEKSPNEQSMAGQRVLYPGAPNLSGEIRIFRLGTCSKKILLYITWSIDHNLAQIDYVDKILK